MSENPYAPSAHAGEVPTRGGQYVFSWGTLLAIAGIGCLLFSFMVPARRTSREAARRVQCTNNLRQIALALQVYVLAHGALPPAYTVDADGKPLHSWRTLILPYLEQNQLYNSIDLSKPWDDPVNAEAFKSTPSVYPCPSSACPQGYTKYLASVGPNSCFHSSAGRNPSEITDGTRTTLMVIEVTPEQSVHWMSPVDADEATIVRLQPTSEPSHPDGTNAAMCDGSVRFLPSDMPAADRRAMISIASGDKFEFHDN